MLRRIALLICTCLACCLLQGQVKKKIKKGRRNKSESQFQTGKNDLQVLWEIGHETVNENVSSTVYPNLQVKYGVTRQLELNTEISFITAVDRTADPQRISGTEPLLVGANYLLQEESAKRPAIILSLQMAIPFLAGKDFTAKYWAPILQFNMEQPLHKKIIVGAGCGVFWDGFLPDPSFIYNISGTYVAGKKISLITELSGFVNGSPPQHNADLSITYTMNRQVQFGITGGIGISPAAHQSYFAINGVWGCHLRKRHT